MMAVILASGNSITAFDLRSEFEHHTRRKLSIGQLYSSLERLVIKGFVKYILVEGCVENGFRPQRSYGLTSSGEQVLREAQELETRIAALPVIVRLGSQTGVDL